jgi:hypothetical protein
VTITCKRPSSLGEFFAFPGNGIFIQPVNRVFISQCDGVRTDGLVLRSGHGLSFEHGIQEE